MYEFILKLAFDLDFPAFFVNTYRHALRRYNPRCNSSLVITTKRLLDSCLCAKEELAKLMLQEANGLISWVLKRKRIQALKIKLQKAQEVLQNWVSLTIN